MFLYCVYLPTNSGTICSLCSLMIRCVRVSIKRTLLYRPSTVWSRNLRMSLFRFDMLGFYAHIRRQDQKRLDSEMWWSSEKGRPKWRYFSKVQIHGKYSSTDYYIHTVAVHHGNTVSKNNMEMCNRVLMSSSEFLPCWRKKKRSDHLSCSVQVWGWPSFDMEPAHQA